METYNILITRPAEEDLYRINSYISKELLEPEIAKSMISKIAKEINFLDHMPFRNALAADERLAYKGIRKVIVDNYIIFYIVTEENKTVTIIRILYSRRNWISLL